VNADRTKIAVETAAAPSTSVEPGDASDALRRRLRREGPMNLARAYEVMERFALDGLVLAEPVNVFHLLGYWPQIANTRAGQPPTTFALLARDSRQPPGLVASRFIYYYTFADAGIERELQVYLYREAADDADGASAADLPAEFPDRGRAPISPVERRRRAALDAAGSAADRANHAQAGSALVAALRGMGLWHGRIGFDHALIEAVATRHGAPGVLVPADEAIRHIRLIKSPLEIALLRRAAIANAAAVDTITHDLRAGASTAELRQRFMVEAAQRGNRSLFLNIDRVSSELSDERIADGQTLFIDGVSHYQHYHGDYARTVHIGDPTAGARDAALAVVHGWRAVREALRPGLRYSEIAALGRDAVRRGGFDVTVGFGPHSVGLMHTDEPGSDAGGFHRKLDLTLCKDMVLSVDCPVLDTGLGGSAHVEDLMLITADGAEPLHALSEGVITV
jgi:Xaa-Pro aminopeptidase